MLERAPTTVARLGPGGWWSWPAAVVVAALVPAGAWSGWTMFGLPPITVSGGVCLLLLVTFWWDEIAPRVVWNDGGFAVRGPLGLHQGGWDEAQSVFLVGIRGGRYGYRLVVVTPSGRFEVVPDRLWWLGRRHAEGVRRAYDELRAARDTAGPRWLGDPPRLMSPIAQLVVVVLLWGAGLAAALPFA